MRRVRRHKRVVALGLVLLVIAPVFALYPDFKKGEVFRRAPNWLLVDLMPFFPTLQEDGNLFVTGNNPGVEFTMRLVGGREPMSHQQTRETLSRVVSGGFFTDPGSPRWQRRVATWMRGQWRLFQNGDDWQYPDGTPADRALNEILGRFHSIYPEPDPSTREVWPVGTRMWIQSGMHHAHWRAKDDQQILTRVLWEIEGTELRGESKHGVGTIWIAEGLEAGREYTVRLKYEIFSRNRLLSTGEMIGKPDAVYAYTRRWRTVSSIDEVFEGYDSQLIQQALIEEVVPVVVHGSAARSILNNPRFEQQEFDELAMGMEVTLSDEQGMIREFHQSWKASGGKLTQMSGGPQTPMGSDEERAEVGMRIERAIDNGTMRVRLRGDFERSLQYFEATRAWDGEIDMLYSDAIAQRDAMLKEQQEAEEGTQP